MSYKKKIISLLYYPYRVFKKIKSLFSDKNRTSVRVLLFHDIPLNEKDSFKEKVLFLSKRWKFISAETFTKYLKGELNLSGNNLLLSFDDGFSSNRIVAEEILNPLGIKAIFFVVTDFIKLTSLEEQKKFIKERLYPEWIKHPLPENFHEMGSLSYADLKYLHQTGHTIGSHTASHPDLSKIASEEELIKEVIESAKELEKKLSIKVDHFSYSFGNISFFSKKALNIAKSHFDFVHTGMRGNNFKSMNSWAIRRDAIDMKDSLNLMASYLEGVADFRYVSSLEKYESWASDLK